MWKGIAYGIGHDQLHSSLETRPLETSRAGNRFGQLKPTNLQNPRNISLRRRPALDCYLIANAYSGDADHDSEAMAITIPSDADHRRSEATLGCSYHAEVIGIRQSFCC